MKPFVFRGRRFSSAVELALLTVGGRWKMPILLRLRGKAWRYGALKRDLGRVTHKMLTQQLRELERDGLVARRVHAVVPPKVEYSLTKLGRSTLPLIRAMNAWGEAYRRHAPRGRKEAPRK